ncbi:MAG: hypothetical protein K2N31_04870, partial [Treponemataceae bacterium]|nr:hypothetical protein [Treponemataceae bacterium]
QTLTLSQHGLGLHPKTPLLFFGKIVSGRQKPFWVERAFVLGKQHPFGFLAKSRRDGENLFGWRSLLCWGSNTRRRFGCPGVNSAKTRDVLVVPVQIP